MPSTRVLRRQDRGHRPAVPVGSGYVLPVAALDSECAMAKHAAGGTEGTDMSDVTVLGLGAMGSALARALLGGGYDVTVWNRTAERAEPLVAEGATRASDPAVALAASPIVIACLRDYEVTQDVLSQPDVAPQLGGRMLLQLAGGSPKEAREMQRWAREVGVEYLDGEIMVYPDGIGSEDAAILVAGPEGAYRRCEPLLRSMAGAATYVGEPIGAAAAHGTAMGAVLYGSLLSAAHAALICEAEGLDVDQFATRLDEHDMPTIAGAVNDLLRRIADGRFDETQGSLRTGADGAEQMLTHALEAGLDPRFPQYVASMHRQAVEAGLGEKDESAVIEIMRASGDRPPEVP